MDSNEIRYDNQKIKDVEISDEIRKAFLDYSMSVIVQRALPDVRDGLKPVHRRILTLCIQIIFILTGHTVNVLPQSVKCLVTITRTVTHLFMTQWLGLHSRFQ